MLHFWMILKSDKLKVRVKSLLTLSQFTLEIGQPKSSMNAPLKHGGPLEEITKQSKLWLYPRLPTTICARYFQKLEIFALDMRERTTDIAFLTEVWEKREKKKHQFKLEEMLEMGGIKYISTPRPGAQRGGGAAIAVRTENFLISKLNIPIPKSVEVVWGVLKPKVITGKISVIIVCCFYSPPKSRKNPIMLEHITHTLQSLLATYLHAGVIISGDRNNIDISALLLIDGFPSYHPNPFHPNIIWSKFSVYRNPLLDENVFSCIQPYTAIYGCIYRCILYIACLDHVSRFCSRSTLSHYFKNKKSLIRVHFHYYCSYFPSHIFHGHGWYI